MQLPAFTKSKVPGEIAQSEIVLTNQPTNLPQGDVPVLSIDFEVIGVANEFRQYTDDHFTYCRIGLTKEPGGDADMNPRYCPVWTENKDLKKVFLLPTMSEAEHEEFKRKFDTCESA